MSDIEAPPSSAPSQAPKRVLGIVFLTMFLDLLGFGIMIPNQPFYAEQFGATPAVVTTLSAAYSLMQLLFAPMWGRLSDRFGRKPIVLTSIAFAIVGYLVLGSANGLWMLFLSRALSGFGNANLGTVQAIIADVLPPKDRAKGMGMIGAAFGLGFVLGPVIGGLVGKAYGADTTAFVAAGLSAANWVLALALLPETRSAAARASTETRGFFVLRELPRALGMDNIGALLVLAFVYTWGFSLMEASLSLFVEHGFIDASILGSEAGRKLATGLTTWVLLAVGVTSVIVQGGLIGPLRKVFEEKHLIVGGALLVAVSFVGLGLVDRLDVTVDGAARMSAGSSWSTAYLAMFPLMVVLSVGSGVLSPAQSALLSRSAPEHEQGLILGLGQSMSAMGRIFGPLIAGVVFEWSHAGPFLVGAVLVTAGALAATRLRRAH